MAKDDSGKAARDDSDLPPDSILVPITQETIWQDLNSAYDSEDSTKGSTNPKSYSNPLPWSKTGSASNRVAATNLNATTSAPIIGLPAKIQRTGFISCHRPPSIFPRGRNNGSKKSGLADSEPGSPKVSCLGHVLSQRERERRRIQRHERRDKENEEQAVMCCFSSILNCGGGDKKRESRKEKSELRRSLSEKSRPLKAVEVKRSAVEEVQRQKKGESKPSPNEEVRRSTEEAEEDAPPPAISAMKKFSSGRRAASWGDDAVAERGALESN